MLTRIEISGFKSFSNFSVDLQPFSVVVGPNASGKSNLFDAFRFISLLAQQDIRTAMQELRGEPEELFRMEAPHRQASKIQMAVELLLPRSGVDDFGNKFLIKAQRVRYELEIALKRDESGNPKSIYISREYCAPILKKEERVRAIKRNSEVRYQPSKPFIRMDTDGEQPSAIIIRQDGETEQGLTRRGRPITLPVSEASRSALSTVVTAEYRHLYAVREALSRLQFLEINPQAARRPNDKLEQKTLKPDASNLAAVLADLHDRTSTDERPEGVLNDIAADLSSLIPSVEAITLHDEPNSREYYFGLRLNDNIEFSSRVISDGTIRLLALLTLLNDPARAGTLCFEEPENGVHEARIPLLIELLRGAATSYSEESPGSFFQIIVNTHSPVVMNHLGDHEIIAADLVKEVYPSQDYIVTRTRMRTNVEPTEDMFDPERVLTRTEIERLLRRPSLAP